jgi:hypothetical protein
VAVLERSANSSSAHAGPDVAHMQPARVARVATVHYMRIIETCKTWKDFALIDGRSCECATLPLIETTADNLHTVCALQSAQGPCVADMRLPCNPLVTPLAKCGTRCLLVCASCTSFQSSHGQLVRQCGSQHSYYC